MPEFSVIIPTYNEEKTVEKAVSETVRVFAGLGKTYEIIVVDDGSSDRTPQIVQDILRVSSGRAGPPLRLVEHAANFGKGAAVATGVQAAQGEWVLFLDSDLATHPSEVQKALPLLGSCDIIIGSRRVAGADIAERQPVYRHLLGRLFNFAIRRYFHLPFRDTQCGFKLFNRRTLMLFQNLKSRGWAFDVELLYSARSRGYRISEIPIIWRNGIVSRVKFGHVLSILHEVHHIKRT